MDPQLVRRRIAQQLNLEDLPDPVWESLLRVGWVSEDDEPTALAFRDAVDTAREHLRVARELARLPEKERAQPHIPERNAGRVQGWAGRAMALSDHAARLAAGLPIVRRFRDRFLGRRALDEDEARALLDSPANLRCRPEYFEKFGASIVGHSAEVLSEEASVDGESVTDRAQIRVSPPGKIFKAAWRRHQRANLRLLDYPGREGWIERLVPWEGSVLDELREVSARLAKEYDWQSAQATWFVLTNQPPLKSPLKGRQSLRYGARAIEATLTLEVAPWVPADEVAAAFRRWQQQVLGRDNRQVGERSLALFRFFTAHMDERGHAASWARLMTEWNREHPQWRCTDRRRFARDVRRAERRILFPDYHLLHETRTDEHRSGWRRTTNAAGRL